MAAGMWFAAEQPQVDRTRVGIWGGSWGGFEALFAAQQADARARPRAVAALYPPSDFADWVGHALTRHRASTHCCSRRAPAGDLTTQPASHRPISAVIFG